MSAWKGIEIQITCTCVQYANTSSYNSHVYYIKGLVHTVSVTTKSHRNV